MSKKYPKYKPSNIDWIGDIPEHWDVKRLKYVADANPSNIDKKSKENEQDVFLCNYVDVYKNEFITSDLDFMKATASDAQIEKFMLKKGDVIATKDSESANDIGIPTLVTEDFEDVVCGYHLTHIKSKKIQGEYLYRQIQSEYTKRKFETLANGITRYALGVDTFNNLSLVIPPALEQTAIANYLNKKTKEIDQLIKDKKELLQLFEKEKTAIISHAITKGLNPNVKLKNSEIEWIGDIPKHWKMMKLKHIVIDKLKYGANESAEEEIIENPRYIRITDFGKNGKLKKDTFKSLPFEKANEYLLNEGDILFARSGATVGKTFQFKDYNGIACFAGYLIKAMPNPSIVLSDYLYLFTKTSNYEQWKNSIFNQATIQNIGADKYSILDITIPKIEEQEVIINFIQKENKVIDSKIKKTKKLIDLLIEYRSALISDVVTGKINIIE
jgi:type I restriction enzyme S subunit